MKERPILFSTPMVQAIQADRKTETRRTTNLKEINENPNDWNLTYKEDGSICWGADEGNEAIFLNEEKVRFIKNPYGQPGDALWVRESYCPEYFDDKTHGYKADWNKYAAELMNQPKWKPSIHMPKAACRIWLMVESVSLERLEDITEEGAISEGVREGTSGLYPGTTYWNYMQTKTGGVVYDSPIHSFRSLWESINGLDSWATNPWVWVVKYRVLTKTGDLDPNDMYAQSFDIQRIERNKK
jgi:hypothetical protein